MPSKDKIIGVFKPPLTGIGLLAIATLLHFQCPPSRSLIRCRACTLALGVLGIALLGWALRSFWKRRTSPLPGSRPSAIVTEGPYAYSRNPMYVAAIMLLMAVATFMGTLPFLMPPIGFFLIMHYLYIPHEERMLSAHLGAPYDEYRSRVRRWI